MVKEIQEEFSHSGYGGGSPVVHIHHIKRNIFGNGIGIKVWGELRIAAKEVVFAKELKLNTLEVLNLTPEHGEHWPIIANKYIHHKGEYDNYASVELFSVDSADQLKAGTSEVADNNPDTGGPSEGSVWLDFIALGE